MTYTKFVERNTWVKRHFVTAIIEQTRLRFFLEGPLTPKWIMLDVAVFMTW